MERLLSKKAVREIVGISFAEIARREETNRFPKRIRDGGRVFWPESEIASYVQSKIAARDATAS